MAFTLFLGTNDSFYGIPTLSESEKILAEIVQVLLNYVDDPRKVLLISPPIADKQMWNSHAQNVSFTCSLLKQYRCNNFVAEREEAKNSSVF